MLRKSTVAGRFYPSNPDRLKGQIRDFFDEKPKIKSYTGKIGVLSPHAGYAFSGKTASYSYKALAETFPETVIIIGPNHTGMGSPLAMMTKGAWETPLGNVEIDSQLADTLLDECEVLDADDTAHRHEHSIEVQLPFLQYLSPDIQFVPISMSMQDQDTAQELGEAIAYVIEDEKVGIIASSDLMHYGRSYGYVPFRNNVIEQMKDMDLTALNAVVDRAPEALYELADKGYTMCGYGCVSAMIYALEEYVTEGEILDYSTSSEVSGDTSTVVGYGSVVLQ